MDRLGAWVVATRLKSGNHRLNLVESPARPCDAANVTNPDVFILRENTGTTGLVQTARTAVEVPFPRPTQAAERLQLVSLEDLISLKLDSWAGSPLRRLRDKSDVVELILRRKLPRALEVKAVVRRLYEETWDALQAEP